MTRGWILIVGAALAGADAPTQASARLLAHTQTNAAPTKDATLRGAQGAPGSYARIAILRPNDGDTVDFEAGYIRHLAWHQQAKDTWTWYGWTITFGERQRWFIYASFGHSADHFDHAVAPGEDERDNIVNVLPHAQFLGSAIYEFLPGLSRGTGLPQPRPRTELTTIDLTVGSEKPFEDAIGASQSTLQGETLWFRMIAGGTAPRYVRLRPRDSVAAILGASSEQALPDSVSRFIARTTVEVLTLRPTMSLGLPSPQQ